MSNASGPRLPDRSGSLVDLFDPSRVIVTDPLMLMCDGLAVRGGATSTGEYSRAVKWVFTRARKRRTHHSNRIAGRSCFTTEACSRGGDAGRNGVWRL